MQRKKETQAQVKQLVGFGRGQSHGSELSIHNEKPVNTVSFADSVSSMLLVLLLLLLLVLLLLRRVDAAS